MLHRQKIAQELDGHAIGQQRGPPDFLTKEFWGTAFGKQRGDRTPTLLLVRLTGTGIQAWAGESELPKEGAHADLVMAFVRERLLAVGALALLLHIFFNLALGYDVLDASQHLFGFLQPKPERFRRELISLEADHFLNTQRRSLLV